MAALAIVRPLVPVHLCHVNTANDASVQQPFNPTVMRAAARAGDFRKVLRLQRALLGELLINEALGRGDSSEVCERITEIVAEVLAAGRVGIWMFDEAKTKITCLDLYVEREGRHVSRNVIHRHDAPRYFDALVAGNVIAADDAYLDPRTSEFSEGYLPAFGIGAMLDVPIYAHRSLLGVMCCEHIGGARRWNGRERLVAGGLAECVGYIVGEAQNIGFDRWRRPA